VQGEEFVFGVFDELTQPRDTDPSEGSGSGSADPREVVVVSMVVGFTASSRHDSGRLPVMVRRCSAAEASTVLGPSPIEQSRSLATSRRPVRSTPKNARLVASNVGQH
jgi:hypothetical protein